MGKLGKLGNGEVKKIVNLLRAAKETSAAIVYLYEHTHYYCDRKHRFTTLTGCCIKTLTCRPLLWAGNLCGRGNERASPMGLTVFVTKKQDPSLLTVSTP